MQIKYWTSFSKRKNSTKQPTGGTTLDVNLKEPCSILSPVFETASVSNSVDYVQAFGNYYFVTDVTHITDDHIRISCAIDSMATAKSQIGNTTAFIERCASDYDLNVPDPYNQPTNDYSIASQSSTITFGGSMNFDTSGCYVLGVMGQSAANAYNGNGVARYYACSPIQLMMLANQLCSHTMLDNLIKEFTNPTDAIISCTWVPFSQGDIGSATSENIYLGSHDTGISAKVIQNRAYGATGSVLITFPDSIPRDYRRNAPYSTGCIYLPFVGTVPLDMDVLYPYDSVDYKVEVDVFTGDIVYNIMRGGAIISTYSGKCATQIPLSSSGYSSLGVGAGVMCAIGGVAASVLSFVTSSGSSALMAVGAGVGALGGGALSAAKSAEIHTTINGSSSSAIGVYQGTDIVITIITRIPLHTPGDIIATVGGVCQKQKTISTMSGFIKCNGASVDLPGLDSIRDEVNGYLNSGFFYE